MNFTDAQKKKIKENLNNIVKYIEENILPHITYSYETGMLDKTDFPYCYYIGLNGPYSDKIRFYCSRNE